MLENTGGKVLEYFYTPEADGKEMERSHGFVHRYVSVAPSKPASENT
jgi:hypothetical protein